MRSKAILMALLALAFSGVEAVPVSQNQAASAARALALGAKAFKAQLGTSVEKVAAHSTTNGALFYAVKMKEGGTVFLSGDTEQDPIIAFTSDSHDFSEIDRKSPLWALLNADVSARKAARLAPNAQPAKAASAWTRLAQAGSGDIEKPLTEIDPLNPFPFNGDLRVDALVKSQWSQSTCGGSDCYNYYTPELRNGKRAVCGCVATAMSQLMRYHQYPTQPAKIVTRACFVEPRYEVNPETFIAEFVGETNLTTSGETFLWDQMPLRPAEVSLNATQRAAIGRLTSDAGISVYMGYNVESGAFMFNTVAAFTDVFRYGNAAIFSATEITAVKGVLENALFANFDAGYPVLLGVRGVGGHAIVGDGYGYATVQNAQQKWVTLPFVHLNMGWSGSYDMWYNLPDMETAGFVVVDEVVFNVFPQGDAESAIVSGRLVDQDGNPVEGATVRLFEAGTGMCVTSVVSSATGVYGAVVPVGYYDIDASKDKAIASMSNVHAVRTTTHKTTINGLILDDGIHDMVVRSYEGFEATQVGNSWGNDMELGEPVVRVKTSRGDDIPCMSIIRALMFAGDLSETLPAGETIDIEILGPVALTDAWEINYNCRIFSSAADPETMAISCGSGAKLVVAPDTRVLFTNVVFATSETALQVKAGGTAALAGKVRLDKVDLVAGGSLEIAGPLDSAYAYKVSHAGSALGTTFGTASVDITTAKAWANLFVNAGNDILLGVVDDGTGDLKWGFGDVPDAAADVKLVQDDTTVNFRTLAQAIGFVTNDAELVVLRDCQLGCSLDVTKNVTIRSENGATITPEREDGSSSDVIAAITVQRGSTLVLSNVVFSGFSQFGEAGKSGNVFVSVAEEGELRMQDGAGLSNIRNSYGTYGAVKVAGSFAMEDGSFIEGCSSEKNGGGVYLTSKAKATIDGGSISGCTAKTSGGGIYVTSGARMAVSGTAVVFGNTQGADGSVKLGNSYFAGNPSACPLTVADGLVGGKIGVQYSSSAKVRNAKGGELAVFADGLADFDKKSAALAFVNDTIPDCHVDGSVADVSSFGTSLVWGDAKLEPGEVPEAEGKIKVDRAGKILYFAELPAALAGLTGGVARVTLLADVMLDSTDDDKVSVNGEVTVDGQGHRIGRDNDNRFLITGQGNALTLTNVTVTGSRLDNAQGGKCSLFRAENCGRLTLEAGTVIRNVSGSDDLTRNVSGVSIWNADLVMRPGAEIYDCKNYSNLGAGGGVIVAGTNSVFRFEGGVISNCYATTGAGVQIDNKSLFIVSGDGLVVDNVAEGGGECNVYVSDLSYLILTNEFTGAIGHSEGVNADTNVFGRVQSDRPALELVPSAARFFRDVDSSVTGCIVTNADETLLVWTTALSTDEAGNRYYEDKEGNVYGELEGAEPPPPPPETPQWTVVTNQPDPIAFKSIDRVSDTEWALVITNRKQYCNYRLISTDDLVKGFTETGDWEHVVNEDCAVWATNVITSGGAWFWRAEGAEGTNMVPPQVEN